MRCLSRSSFCNDVEVPTNLFSTMEITTNPFIVMTKADFEAAIAQIATRLQPVQSINQPAPAPPTVRPSLRTNSSFPVRRQLSC